MITGLDIQQNLGKKDQNSFTEVNEFLGDFGMLWC
jgi:hypothetical protein